MTNYVSHIDNPIRAVYMCGFSIYCNVYLLIRLTE